MRSIYKNQLYVYTLAMKNVKKKKPKKTTALQQHQKEYLKLKLKEVHGLKAETLQEKVKEGT